MQKVRKGQALARSRAAQVTELSTGLEQEPLEPGYKSLVTPHLAGTYMYALALRCTFLRALVHHAYIRTRSLKVLHIKLYSDISDCPSGR